MKKTLFLLLLVIAVPLYSYNVLLLLKVSFPWNRDTRQQHRVQRKLTFEQLLVAAMPADFIEKGRDPFLIEKPKRAAKKVQVKKRPEKKVKKKVEAPPIRITGIMWHPENPVAMLKLAGGATKMVKQGQTFGSNITVKRIEKRRVVVISEGKEFVIDKK